VPGASATDDNRTATDESAEELRRVVTWLPGDAEERPGQIEMAQAVAKAIESGQHVIVRAGTGTGKTLGYLVPAIISGRRVVVATATKALQDQLANKDLPFLERHLEHPFTWALLKGRSNYLCMQRLAELPDELHGSEDDAGPGQDPIVESQLPLDGLAERADMDELATIASWASTTPTGDRAELPIEPSDATWAAVSTTWRDCPGARRCPRGEVCFAERARETAAEADVIVVNMHLYGLHLAVGGTVLPEHDMVVIDEAHMLDDIISATCGIELGAGRFTHLARLLRGILTDAQPGGAGGRGASESPVRAVGDAGEMLANALRPHLDQRVVPPLPDGVDAALAAVRQRVSDALAALGGVPDSGPGDDSAPDDAAARAQRARQAGTALLDDIDRISQPSDGEVVWVDGGERSPVLRLAPIDIARLLHDNLWDRRSAVLTSATIPAGYGRQIGLPPSEALLEDVGSPFDYASNAVIYCAAHLPPPSSNRWLPAAIDELEVLILAAGGRTLALFTSFRAMRAATDALSERLPYPVMTQGDLPKPRLVEAFADDEQACLFATMSFWQGIDVPGPSLSLVTIDRLPFPRPDEPLLQARRERIGDGAFAAIDVPRAATLLAQGAGRLIRSRTDRGAVAVFDPRLATAGYGPSIVAALPKMRRTRNREDVVAFLRQIRSDPESG
jgi:ATP-dependent DNA helicase DinG